MYRLFPLITAACLCASCSTVIEHARMVVAEDVSSTVQLLMSDAVDKVSPSDSSRNLTRYEAMAKACGASTRLYGGAAEGKFFLQADFAARTRAEFEAAAQCAKSKDERFPSVTLEAYDGFFGRKYVVGFSQDIPFKSLGAGTAKEFTFTMPGKITDFSDQSKINGGSLKTQLVDGNRMHVRLVELPAAEVDALLERICPRKNCAEEVLEEAFKIDLKFKLTSTGNALDLPLVTTLAGIVLGLGLAFGIYRWFFARGKKDA